MIELADLPMVGAVGKLCLLVISFQRARANKLAHATQ